MTTAATFWPLRLSGSASGCRDDLTMVMPWPQADAATATKKTSAWPNRAVGLFMFRAEPTIRAEAMAEPRWAGATFGSLLLGVLTLAPSAHADVPRSFEFRWDGPSECPTAQEVRALVL